jgi:O-antigen/teichoic acid export membrane protein
MPTPDLLLYAAQLPPEPARHTHVDRTRMLKVTGLWPTPYGRGVPSLHLRLASAGFWTLAGALGSRILTVLASILVARTLGDVAFGELGMVQSTAGMFAVLGSFGLAATGAKHVAEFRTRDPATAGRVIGLSTLVALLTGALAATLLVLFSQGLAASVAAPHLSKLLVLSSSLLIFGALAAAQTGAVSGLEGFRGLAWVNITAALLSFPAMIAGAFLAGLRGCLLALIFTAAITCLLSLRILRKETRSWGIQVDYRVSRQELRILWIFSLPAVMTGALVMPTYWICSAIIANQPGGYAELGIFHAASTWRSAILFLPGLVGPLLLPFSSSLKSEGQTSESRRLLGTGVFINICLAALVALPVGLMAGTIMRIYGQQFETGDRVLVLLAVLAVIMAATSAIWHTLMGWGAVWLTFAVSVLWAGSMIALTWLLRGLGAEGLAWSTLIAHLVQLAGYGICLSIAARTGGPSIAT